MFEFWEGEADGRGTENVDVCANREAEKPRKHRDKTPSLNHFIHPQQQGAELLKPLSNISISLSFKLQTPPALSSHTFIFRLNTSLPKHRFEIDIIVGAFAECLMEDFLPHPRPCHKGFFCFWRKVSVSVSAVLVAAAVEAEFLCLGHCRPQKQPLCVRSE